MSADLVGDDVVDENLVGVKNVVVIHVTDLADGVADDLVDRYDDVERLAPSADSGS